MQWRNSKWSALLVGVLVALTAEAGVYKRLRRNDGSSNPVVFTALASAPALAEQCAGSLDGITTSRASSAYCQKSDGTMTLLSSNTTRVESAGVLVEPVGTNVILRSQEIDSATWTKTNGSISATNSTGPTGAVVETFLAAAGSARHNIAQAYTATTANWVCSAIVKKPAGSVDYAWLSINNGTNYTHFHLGNGTKGTEGTGNTGAIESLSDSHYRISVSRAMTAGATQVHVGLSNADAAATFAAAGTETLLISDVQCELGLIVTSPIITLGTSATRVADSTTATIASFSSAGGMCGSVTYLSGGAHGSGFVFMDIGASSLNHFQLQNDNGNAGTCVMVTTGGNVATGSLVGGLDSTAARRFVCRWNGTNQSSGTYDGTSGSATGTATNFSPDRVTLGTLYGGAPGVRAWYRNIQVGKTSGVCQ